MPRAASSAAGPSAANGSRPALASDATIPALFETLIAYHLRIAQEASFQAIRQGAEGSGLQPGWYTVLTILQANPGLTPSELSLHCGRDRSTLTGTLQQLARRGLISRRRNRADQRSYAVRLTAKGATMLEQLRQHSMQHDARLDAIIGKQDKPKLIAMLQRIVTGLGQTKAAAKPRGLA
jgi:DNA-binding MarR family transcriptional regulator